MVPDELAAFSFDDPQHMDRPALDLAPEWELDTAQEQFENALTSASNRGAGQEALVRAAGLGAAELQEFLDGGTPPLTKAPGLLESPGS